MVKSYSFIISQRTIDTKNRVDLETLITNSIEGVVVTNSSFDGNNLNIDFESNLNNKQRILLHKLILSWDTAQSNIYEKIIPVHLSGTGIKNTNYTRYGVYGYLGSNTLLPINKICVISYSDNNVSSYNVRIFNVTNSTVIAEATFSNKSEQLLDMGTISNVPTGSSLLEIHLKVNSATGNASVYSSMVIFYS